MGTTKLTQAQLRQLERIAARAGGEASALTVNRPVADRLVAAGMLYRRFGGVFMTYALTDAGKARASEARP